MSDPRKEQVVKLLNEKKPYPKIRAHILNDIKQFNPKKNLFVDSRGTDWSWEQNYYKKASWNKKYEST